MWNNNLNELNLPKNFSLDSWKCCWSRASHWAWYVELWAGWEIMKRRRYRRPLLCCRKEKQLSPPQLHSPSPPAPRQSQTGSLTLFKRRLSETWCPNWRWTREMHFLNVDFRLKSTNLLTVTLAFIIGGRLKEEEERRTVRNDQK